LKDLKIEIYIPSYKRPKDTLTNKWITNSILAVHESEAEEYQKHNSQKLLVLPDRLKGNMASVRNFILDNSKADLTVMIDDDVKSVGYHENMERNEISEGDLYYKLLEWSNQAKQLNTVLFGINLQSDPRFYMEYIPINLLSPVLGTFCCILKTDIRYDERLGLNEDYDFSLKVLQKHHKILRWNKYYYIADHLEKEGGCGAYRTFTKEKEQAKL